MSIRYPIFNNALTSGWLLFIAVSVIAMLITAMIRRKKMLDRQQEAFSRVEKELASLKDLAETQPQILEELRQIKDLLAKNE